MIPRRTSSLYVCTCTHVRRVHIARKGAPSSPCQQCDCANFSPEPVCRCGHGLKSHRRKGKGGKCNQAYLDGCTVFRPWEE